MLSKIQNRLTAAYVGYALWLYDTQAFAQTDPKGNLRKIFGDTTFRSTVTLGFAIYTAFEWFNYFNNFDTGSAFRNLWKPAVLTFLTFQWYTVLQWVGIA